MYSLWVAVEPAVCTVCRRRRSKVCSTLVHLSATPCRMAGDMKRPLIAINLSLHPSFIVSVLFRRRPPTPFPPLCSDQSPAGMVRETVYRRRWAFPVAGPTVWNSLPDNVISAPSLSTFRQRLKTFLLQPSFPDIIIDPW